MAHGMCTGPSRASLMSYNNLSIPVTCEWVFPDSNLLCGQTFTDIDLFTAHVRDQHLPNPYTPGDEETTELQDLLSGVCCWRGCSFKSLTPTSLEFINHVLYHPYHSYLKLVGLAVIKKRELPNCCIDPSLSNLLPALEVQLQCYWNDGHSQCGVVFDSVADFYRHVHQHASDKKIVTCHWGNCTFKGRDHNKVREHLRSHLKEKVVACPTCGALFANNTKFSDHISKQQSGSFKCSFCSKVFSTERLLRDHARRHINTLQCPQCDLTCQGPSRLLSHIRYRHMTVKPHECALCHKTFKTSHALSEHIETHKENNIFCTYPDCSFKTSNSRAMERHLRSAHTADCMAYCCHVCNKRFPSGKKLTKHLKTDHGFQLPPGHCRFRYLAGVDGLKRLQTVRLDDENLVTPELNTYSSSNPSIEAMQPFD